MKNVLITGASSGIGRELAKQFAKRGNNLVIVARRQDLLEELKQEIQNDYDVKVNVFSCDITKGPKTVYDYCHENNIRIDVLVNNAGKGDYGSFIDSDINKDLEIIDLNNKALVALTYYFIKDMKENGYGHILNVGSVASFVPGPYMAVYYATKAFVLSFSMAIRQELKGDNINVSVLCPAPTKSPFWEVANGTTNSVYNNIFARTPKQVAKTGYHVYEKNLPYEVDGITYKLLIGFVRHMPLEMCSRTVAYIQSKTKSKKN